jgi:hypothetical protein
MNFFRGIRIPNPGSKRSNAPFYFVAIIVLGFVAGLLHLVPS